ncbi:hypothetical protein N665_0035s0019 [Sinapis alba]|nr:hypothetical protein N665_0035s0019 [Sinapis alba]
MFADKLGITMEVYIDDMLVKSLIAKDHIQHLAECFETLNKYGMKLNPAKCTFGVTSCKFLGYIMTQRVAALNRFISWSTDKCLPFYELLRGNKKFLWDEACEKAFTALKRYLTTTPVLAKPDAGDTIYLYIAVSPFAVSHARKNGPRNRYLGKEATSLFPISLYRSSHRLPLRTILQNANQSGRLSKWAIELSEYDIMYKARPTIKAQVLADIIIEIPPDQAAELEIPVRSWILHVDGASSNKGSGIGVHLQTTRPNTKH